MFIRQLPKSIPRVRSQLVYASFLSYGVRSPVDLRWGLDAEDRLNHRWVRIINIVGSDTLKKGSFLEVQLLDSQEFVEVEVLGIRRIGNDLELELLDPAANNHFFVELAVDGLAELKANATGL